MKYSNDLYSKTQVLVNHKTIKLKLSSSHSSPPTLQGVPIYTVYRVSINIKYSGCHDTYIIQGVPIYTIYRCPNVCHNRVSQYIQHTGFPNVCNNRVSQYIYSIEGVPIYTIYKVSIYIKYSVPQLGHNLVNYQCLNYDTVLSYQCLN